jgi:hypothetical protein
VAKNVREASVQLVLFVLRPEIDRRALSNRHPQPWPAKNVCDCPHQFHKRLADCTVTREEVGLQKRNSAFHRPQPLRYRLRVPVGNIDEGKRAGLLVLTLLLATFPS